MLKKLFLAISAFTILTAANLSFAPEAQARGKGLTVNVPPVVKTDTSTSWGPSMPSCHWHYKYTSHKYPYPKGRMKRWCHLHTS